MQTTILQFTNLTDLIKYRNFIHTDNFELNTNSFTIAFQCTEKELNEAVANYGATIVYRSVELPLRNKNSKVC